MRAAVASSLLLAAAASVAGDAVDPRSLAPGEPWSIPGLRFEDGSAIRAPLELRRFDPYAAGARIWLVDGKRRTEVARSERVLLVSTRTQTGERLFLSLDPHGSDVRGASLTLSGLREFEGRLVDGRIVVGRSKTVHTDADGFQCGNDTASLEVAGNARERPPRTHVATHAVAKAASHEARIAVDTDSEFLSLKFGGNTAQASTYLAELFAGMNVIYERDLGVTLRMGDVFLYAGADPYPSTADTSMNAQLDELGAHWLANRGSVQRAFVTQLSGKSANASRAQGLAWVLGSGNYCATPEYHNSLVRVFRFNGATAASDLGIVAHELGHNFGVSHTHCTDADPVASGLQPIDRCYAQENGCYAGTAVSCPTDFGGKGTLMSYCQYGTASGGANCGANLKEFHPVHEVLLAARVAENIDTCFTPTAAGASDVVFEHGFEA